MSTNALVPVEQAIVPFYGNKIFGFRLSDERMVASLNSFCKMLKLAKHGQMERIRRDKDLAEHLLVIMVETPNGSQHVDVLEIEAIRLWVMGIQVNLIAEEKRPLVKALREQAYETLSRALLKPEPRQPAHAPPEAQVETEAPAQPIHNGPHATHDSPWERLFAALHEIRQEEQAKAGRLVMLEEWVRSLDGRVAGMGPGAAEVGWLPLLSGAHLAEMRTLLRSLEQATGRAQGQLEQELVETFRVAAINALPEEQWEDVLAWSLWQARAQQAT